MNKLVGKYIWVQDERWKVVAQYAPTKWDDYLVCQRPDEYTSHEDGTSPILMTIIDCHNEEFVLSNKQMDKIVRAKYKEKKALADWEIRKHDRITEEWLKIVRNKNE